MLTHEDLLRIDVQVEVQVAPVLRAVRQVEALLREVREELRDQRGRLAELEQRADPAGGCGG